MARRSRRPFTEGKQTASTIREVTRSGAPSIADTAYYELKRRIIRCVIAPGARTTEATLAELIGVGKTPVREALTRLAHEGLIRRFRGHGCEIAPITLADVHELYDFRLLIEAHAVRLAAGHLEPLRLERLDELCGAVYSTDAPESILRFLDANRQFHVAIAEASSNRRLAETVARVLDETERLFVLGHTFRNLTKEAAHEHKNLVEALIAGDADAAEKHAVEHILQSKQVMLTALSYSPQVLSVSIGAPRLQEGKACP